MRASGSYESLIRGVSQQVPHDRQIGQHTAQVNMLSDPVNGLTRRHGSSLVAERKYPLLSVDNFEAYKADTDTWRTFEHSQGGNDYVIFCRMGPKTGGSTALPLLVVFNKTTNTWANMNRNAVDPLTDELDEGGISAGVALGNYFFMAGNTVPTQGSEVALWNNFSNLDKAVIWIRGGAYSRTYRGTFTLHNGTQISGTYTTPASAYPGVLDTSDILTGDPDYTKKVNDRVNAYNAAVTQWIGTSTAAIQPQAIAASLVALFANPFVTATANGSHVVFTGIRSMSVDDGGDGSLVAGVADEVESVDKLSLRHYAGKIVKVRTRNTENAFYMKAIPKDRAVADGVVTEVTWVECAGDEFHIDHALFFATMVGDECYYASSSALLTALVPSIDHPDYAVSTAGDHTSNPVPYATGRYITYLGVFQDRLLVGAGGTVLCSKIGDYLNWFRTTMLTVPADDAFEMRAQGPDDDVLRWSVMYDQSLVLFGDRRQYVVSGKIPLAPSSANMAVMSAYADTANSPPHVAGGLIFYAKRGETFSSVNEIQPGRGLQNSPESFPASSQIDSYLLGDVIEFTSNADPCTLFVRTTGARNSVYTFFYVDSAEGRKVDAWSRWDFAPELGLICGMTPTAEGVHLYFLREGHDGVYAVSDLCTLTVGLSTRPYLDSQRPWAAVELATGSVRPTTAGAWFAAFDSTAGNKQWLGSKLEDANAMETTYPGVTGLTVGAQQIAYVEPTNPYMRDSNGKAILSGRLTITGMRIATANSAGFKATVDVGGTQTNVIYTGRVIGEPTVVGVEQISTNVHTVPIGRETKAYSLRLAARSWLPFTVTAIEWSGQYFNRTQRFT